MSNAIANAALLQALRDRAGVAVDYENLLQWTYSQLITPGGTVVDIGAHSGRHAAVFADLVGPSGAVHAFEPLPLACEYFRSRSLGSHVTLHQQAVASRRGREPFVFAAGAPEESGFVEKAYNQPGRVNPERIEVDVAPLDDIVDQLHGLQFIKVDAEGAEIDCIRSARETIARYRPILSVEYGFPSYSAFGLKQRDLFDLATAMKYKVGDLFGAVCETADDWSQVCDRASWDWYLVPEERVEPWSAALAINPVADRTRAYAQAAELRAELAIIRNSTSWRVTAPLRAAGRLIKGR